MCLLSKFHTFPELKLPFLFSANGVSDVHLQPDGEIFGLEVAVKRSCIFDRE